MRGGWPTLRSNHNEKSSSESAPTTADALPLRFTHIEKSSSESAPTTADALPLRYAVVDACAVHAL